MFFWLTRFIFIPHKYHSNQYKLDGMQPSEGIPHTNDDGMKTKQHFYSLSSPANNSRVCPSPPPTDGDLARVLPGPCWVAHSRCPLIKLQPCSLLSCWQTKVLKRTPSVIASNLRPNVLFHVNVSQRKGSRCSRLASTFTLSNTAQQTSAWTFFF